MDLEGSKPMIARLQLEKVRLDVLLSIFVVRKHERCFLIF